ncbi:MAG: hypothetical protein HOY71_55345 [Nonomuraea sp.]|nr:hypothetical protein [Nonomuraea sp.]
MLIIAAAHTAVFAPLAPWGSWLAGDLRTARDPDSVATFWALPGGFVVTLALLGILVARAGRRGERVPAYFGWVVLAWGAFATYLIGPGGFVSAVVPAGLIIAASFTAERQPVS